jgi:hypothetical protein
MSKIICDSCNNFEVSIENTKEICHAKKYGDIVIPIITDDYIRERMDGIKKSCKGFKKIITNDTTIKI